MTSSEITPQERKRTRRAKPFHVATVGRVKVPVYRRLTPAGNPAFMVSNYSGEKRRFDCYSDPDVAVEEAGKLARRLSERDVVSASMTREQSIEYADAVQALKPFGLGVRDACAKIAEVAKALAEMKPPLSLSALSSAVAALKAAGGEHALTAAVDLFRRKNRKIERKRVAVVVAELLEVKRTRKKSERYLEDLDSRLTKFAEDFAVDICDIATPDVQQWLDGKDLVGQTYVNFRRVLHLLFAFAAARGYAVDNPVDGTEKGDVPDRDIEIYTPEEIARLLSAATENYPKFVPALALGAFAGLRSAEVQRLDWSDIDLVDGLITVGISASKTATRRIVPIHPNLKTWLAAYVQRQGKVAPFTYDAFYQIQRKVAALTEVEADADKGVTAKAPVAWRGNALRHSYATYRFAQLNDAGRVAGEMGNSAAMVHRHYRNLAKPAEATRWFSVAPDEPSNVLALPQVGNP